MAALSIKKDVTFLPIGFILTSKADLACAVKSCVRLLTHHNNFDMKTVLAIDPGYKESAYVIWDGVSLLAKEILANSVFLDVLTALLQQPTFQGVACERVASYGMSVGKEVFETCFVTGRVWQTIQLRTPYGVEMPFALVPRLYVKQAICHDSRAKDSNINQALKDRFGKGKTGKGTKDDPSPLYGMNSHLWAALALGVAVIDEPRLMVEHSASLL